MQVRVKAGARLDNFVGDAGAAFIERDGFCADRNLRCRTDRACGTGPHHLKVGAVPHIHHRADPPRFAFVVLGQTVAELVKVGGLLKCGPLKFDYRRGLAGCALRPDEHVGGDNRLVVHHFQGGGNPARGVAVANDSIPCCAHQRLEQCFSVADLTGAGH